MNILTGRLEKYKKNKTEAHYFRDYNEMLFHIKYSGLKQSIEIGDGDKVYVAIDRQTCNMKEGFIPIKYQIYDANRLHLYIEAIKLAKKGFNLIAIKTDALFYDVFPKNVLKGILLHFF